MTKADRVASKTWIAAMSDRDLAAAMNVAEPENEECDLPAGGMEGRSLDD